NGIHPPTMYFPLIVHEALMFEPTETESIETLDHACEVMFKIKKQAEENGAELHNCPVTTIVGRADEVNAARNPILKYERS
ncbi:MAG TPA: aminomethyl-transferring glycine dehydrogenase subunit GcvPB, partial [Clostridia bacterium]|nr:aminomethyl-transferring glycine dehydrogenase subunit GcvPB [Clostridia bacterium]